MQGMKRTLAMAATAASLATTSSPTGAAETADARAQRGQAVVDALSGGAGQPVLDELRRDFPPLGEATLNYALGEIVGRTVLDPQARQLATVAMLAAQDLQPQLRIHAGYALNLGAAPAELNEIVYLTTVYAGFPRALNAAATLRALYDERGIALPVEDAE
ncbi:carboxymuconolactone decarboxylase family protein [Geminicoccus flavidas]|uniref:carboxymuconolactone decarboxylase family protein n=1 Tax=Geminicoccus flavidas TaxID=2506407 RepID=UPI00135AFAF9|nr:carboxymuconolactone decarboxylase family protein [Geminicoccus flavidas]